MNIYLAGPDVFKENAKEIGNKMKELCQKHGLNGLFPLDNEIAEEGGKDVSMAIFEANRAMIDSCDIVIANLNSFRGTEPDSGTIWEVGYAIGKGKKVLGYIDNPELEYIDRVKLDIRKNNQSFSFKNGILYDENGMAVEDFKNPLNLMIAKSVEGIYPSFESALNSLNN